MSMRFGAAVLIRRVIGLGCVLACLLAATAIAGAQEIVLHCDAAQTAADFNLGGPSAYGQGQLPSEEWRMHFDPAAEKISGEIVFDATSGQSGNGSRDRKCTRTSSKARSYPEISFRPDRWKEGRAHGNVQRSGAWHVPHPRSRARNHRSRRGHSARPTIGMFSHIFPCPTRNGG